MLNLLNDYPADYKTVYTGLFKHIHLMSAANRNNY